MDNKEDNTRIFEEGKRIFSEAYKRCEKCGRYMDNYHKCPEKPLCRSEETKKILRELALRPERIAISIRNLPRYNKGEGPLIGTHQSEVTKRKISENIERAKKISEKLKGISKSEEAKQNMRHPKSTIINMCKPKSEEHKKRMRKPKSEEHKIKISATKQGILLEEWERFIHFEPYTKEFNKAFKLAIKQRDGFMCLKCGMREEDHLKLFNQKEHIHHINYDKKLTIPENCCILCIRCNAEVNSNSSHWTKFFQSILTERYSYQYVNEEIILNLNKEIENE